jgi:hypothetical protein
MWRWVMVNEASDESPRLFERQRHVGAEAIGLERLVPALNLAIRLRIVGTGAHVSHTAETYELMEVAGDELWTVVSDNPRMSVGEPFPRSLQVDFHVSLTHRFAEFPVNDVKRAADSRPVVTVSLSRNNANSTLQIRKDTHFLTHTHSISQIIDLNQLFTVPTTRTAIRQPEWYISPILLL